MSDSGNNSRRIHSYPTTCLPAGTGVPRTRSTGSGWTCLHSTICVYVPFGVSRPRRSLQRGSFSVSSSFSDTIGDTYTPTPSRPQRPPPRRTRLWTSHPLQKLTSAPKGLSTIRWKGLSFVIQCGGYFTRVVCVCVQVLRCGAYPQFPLV